MEKSIFDLEVREKKNQAFLNKAKTGAKGGSSSRKGMRTPFDFMSKQEKKNLNGEVKVTNMFTTILEWNEWNLKDKETQKELMTKWREVYPNTEIMKTLQIGRDKPFNSQSFADIVNDLGCPKKTHQNHSGVRKPRKSKNIAIAKVEEKPTLLELALEHAPEPEPQVQPILVTNGLNLEYNGEFDAEQLARIFTKMQLLVDGETNKFKISLRITECD